MQKYNAYAQLIAHSSNVQPKNFIYTLSTIHKECSDHKRLYIRQSKSLCQALQKDILL